MAREVAHHELTTCQGGVDALSVASWFGDNIKPPSSLPPSVSLTLQVTF